MKKFIISLILSFATFAYAEVGKIVESFGETVVERSGEKIEVKKVLGKIDFDLEKGDIISTGKNGRAKILLKDKTKISIGKSSVLSIDEYLFDDKEPVAEFSLTEGTFRAITGKIGKIAPEKFKFKTRNATIGIRGTGFAGNKDKIFCLSGLIFVSTPFGAVDLSAGQMADTSGEGEPTPRKYSWKERIGVVKASGWHKGSKESFGDASKEMQGQGDRQSKDSEEGDTDIGNNHGSGGGGGYSPGI